MTRVNRVTRAVALIAAASIAADCTDQSTGPRPPASPSLELAATATADGSRIAFVSNRDGNFEIYVMNADGSGQTRLTNSPNADQAPRWSPDGTKVAFESSRDGNLEIYAMKADGSGQTRLTNEAAIDANPNWSPDGQRIAFYSSRGGNTDIYVMNRDGTGQTRLTSNVAIDADPSWSPDGQQIAFQSNRDGNLEIYTMRADGSGLMRLTTNSAVDGFPTWSRDGTRIAFTSERDGDQNVYVMNADGTGQTRLTDNAAPDAAPRWSPDGTQIAFTSFRDGGYDVYVMRADGSGQTRLTTDGAFDADPDWGPAAPSPPPTTGERIVFTSTRDGSRSYDIYVMRPDGSEQTRLTDDPAEDLDPRWSPDGTRIAFSTSRDGDREIYVMNADGSAPTRLTNSLGPDLVPAWSPDGRRMAFASLRDGNTDIYVMNTDGTGQTRLTDNPAHELEPEWSPDGRHIAFVSDRALNNNIYVMNPDGSGQIALTNGEDPKTSPRWSPDGRRIAFQGLGYGGIQIFVMNADGSGQTPLGSNASDDQDPSWSPDGQKITFTSRRDGNLEIYIMNADGSNPTRLTFDPAFDFSPDWTVGAVSLPNRVPVANAGLDRSIIRSSALGASVPLDGSGSSDPDGDPLSYEWREGSTMLATGPTPTVTLGLGVHALTLEVRDGKGGSSTDDVAMAVHNSPPTAQAGGPYAGDEGAAIPLALSATDVDGAALTFTWDLGDGTTGTGSVPPTSHVYADGPSTHTITLAVRDADGGSDAKTAAVMVTNVAPVLGAVSIPFDPVPLGATVTASASFNDAGPADTHVGFVQWDQGSSFDLASPGVNQAAKTLSASRALAAGVYTISLRIRDDDGGEDTKAASSYVVVYDPSAGFATGGGWITSPAGAYAPDPALAGKASFGFVAKYLKGTTIPTGNTEFQFQEGNLAFQSTSYQWLVVAGAKAQFKGEGAINGGATVYGFLLTAIDGQLNGGGGADRFRLKIWDKTTDAVIYDNQRGAVEDGDAATVLGGGSIVIHK